jgi:hypothetical protein
MASTRRAPRRVLAVLLSSVLAVAAAVAAPPAALAVPADGSALATAQIDGVAFAQAVHGDTVYVGGSFRYARPAGARPGTHRVVRRNLLAYDLATGRLRSWAPRTNGVVRALAVSPDGRTVYAAGAFTKVDGHPRQRVAAISAAGGVRADFHPRLNSAATSLALHGSTVYVGGQFTAAGGRSRSRAAAFDRTTGRVRAWHPRPDGPVLALVVSSTGRSVVLGGRFAKVNGRTAPGTARVGTKAGTTNLTWKVNAVVGNHGAGAAVYSLSSSGGFVYGTGYSFGSSVPHRLEGAFVASWRSGAVHWIEDCHGDSYSAARGGATVYVVGHAHYCGNIGGFRETDPRSYHRALAFTQAATGTVQKNRIKPYSDFGGRPAPTLLDWRPAFDTGSATGQDQGPWSVVTSGEWVLYAGEFTKVAGVRRQGLVRFRG